MPNVAFYHIDAPHEGKVAVVKDGQMIDFTHEGRLGAWINSEKESSFAEFTLKTAKRFLKHKFVVVAVDKGKIRYTEWNSVQFQLSCFYLVLLKNVFVI